MLLKTILVIVVLYLMIKVISRLFLPQSARNNARIIFRTFQNLNQQMNEQGKNRGSRDGEESGRRGDGQGGHFDEIEEAEFEDVTDDEKPE